MIRSCRDDIDLAPVAAPDITVDVTDPIVVAQLLGPDGAVLLEVTDRGWVPFGFQPRDTP